VAAKRGGGAWGLLGGCEELGQGEWNLGMWEGRFGVLKFEMSLRREDDETYGVVDGNGGSSPSIFV
jgi:hypothetical protein